jgi:hypothetical protein
MEIFPSKDENAIRSLLLCANFTLVTEKIQHITKLPPRWCSAKTK